MNKIRKKCVKKNCVACSDMLRRYFVSLTVKIAVMALFGLFKKEEKEILERMTTGRAIKVSSVFKLEKIFELRELMHQIYIDEKVKDYILDLVFATRNPEQYKLEDLKPLISYGASPRASIMLTTAARANAFLQGRGYVTPDDVKQIGMDVLRHRVLITYEAEAEDMTSDDIVKKIFDQVEVP